jgi:hypothetical protein
MPGHYNKPPAPKPPAPPKPKRKPRAPKPAKPPAPKSPFDEQNTEDAAGGTYKPKPVPGGPGPKRTYTPERD